MITINLFQEKAERRNTLLQLALSWTMASVLPHPFRAQDEHDAILPFLLGAVD